MGRGLSTVKSLGLSYLLQHLYWSSALMALLKICSMVSFFFYWTLGRFGLHFGVNTWILPCSSLRRTVVSTSNLEDLVSEIGPLSAYGLNFCSFSSKGTQSKVLMGDNSLSFSWFPSLNLSSIDFVFSCCFTYFPCFECLLNYLDLNWGVKNLLVCFFLDLVQCRLLDRLVTMPYFFWIFNFNFKIKVF